MRIYLPEITFSLAHYIAGHKGKCAGIHGHTYYVKDLVIDLDTPTFNEMGITVDFGDIKDYFNTQWDHKFLVPSGHYMYLERALLQCDFPEELNPPMISNMIHLEYTSAEIMALTIKRDLEELAYKNLKWVPRVHFKLFEGPHQAIQV